MQGLRSKPWDPSMDPATFTSKETGPLVLVVQPDKLRYCQKFAVPPRHWEVSDLPRFSRLRDGQMLGKWVAVSDLPQGRVLRLQRGLRHGPVDVSLWGEVCASHCGTLWRERVSLCCVRCFPRFDFCVSVASGRSSRATSSPTSTTGMRGAPPQR